MIVYGKQPILYILHTNASHRHSGGGAEPALGPFRPGGTGHDDNPGGVGGGLDDDGTGDQRSL